MHRRVEKHCVKHTTQGAMGIKEKGQLDLPPGVNAEDLKAARRRTGGGWMAGHRQRQGPSG